MAQETSAPDGAGSQVCIDLHGLQSAICKSHGAMAMQDPSEKRQMTTGAPQFKLTAGTNVRVHPVRPRNVTRNCRLQVGQAQYSQSASLARHGRTLGITPYLVWITPYFGGLCLQPQEYYPIIT